MKLSFFAGAAVGYVLGARAGHERYEAIVRMGRQIVGSQTVQSTAGVLQAQFDDLTKRAKGVATRVHNKQTRATATVPNGRRPE